MMRTTFRARDRQPPEYKGQRWVLRLVDALPSWLTHAVIRAAKPTYVLAVAVVVCRDDGQLLLLEHTYGRPRWRLPGGLVERGETWLAAAVRETWEEASCVVRPIALVDAKPARISYDLAVYAQLLEEQEFRRSAEVSGRQWLPLAAAARQLPPAQRAFVAAVQRLRQEI